jgi:hypothetical protein
MRLALWAVVAVLIVLVLAGDKVRGFFKKDAADVATASSSTGKASETDANRGNAKPSADKPQPAGSYVPSPADAPELYDSPIRRFGL